MTRTSPTLGAQKTAPKISLMVQFATKHQLSSKRNSKWPIKTRKISVKKDTRREVGQQANNTSKSF